MRHFAEFIIFNGFNSISFRTAAKVAVARADEKPGPRRRRFLKNNTVRQRLWQEIVGFVARPCPVGEPLWANSGLGNIGALTTN
jgi:hypothetical protein